MSLQDNALRTLAGRMGCGDEASERIRETLESSLIPLMRRVLRTGAGIPHLVRWVQATLPQVQAGQDRTRPADPERTAARLAHLLCASLFRKQWAQPNAAFMDTIVGL